MKRLILCSIALTLSLVTVAEAGSFSAVPHEDRWDFSIQTRYSWSKEFSDADGAKVEFDDDLGWGFGFSKYITPQFNLGLAFGWHSIYYTATGVSEDGDSTGSYGNTLSTSAIVLTGDYTFGTKRFRPYVTGNLGWMRANTNIAADLDGGCWYYPWVGYVCGTWVSSTYGDDSFTYGLGLGARIYLSPASFLKIGWEHSWNDFDAWDSNDVLRVDLGFLL